MNKVVIKAGTLSAAATLHAKRRRANDNVIDVPVAAGAQVCGVFTAVAFDHPSPNATVVHASPRTGSATVVRAAHGSELLASNSNRAGAFSVGWTAIGLRSFARLWAAFSRERAIARAASKLASMSDLELHDIGIQRSDIDFAVRFGRSYLRTRTPTDARVEAER